MLVVTPTCMKHSNFGHMVLHGQETYHVSLKQSRLAKMIVPFLIFFCLQRKALTVNMPINSRHPNWNVYRMSKASMNNLVLQSTHFRFTCNFKNYIKSSGFKDYLRAKLSSISPLTFSGAGLCRVVEYINIR